MDGLEIDRSRALEQGFLFVPQCIDAEQARWLRELVLRVCRRRGWMPPALYGFAHDSQEYFELQRAVHALPEFGALRDSPSTRLVIERLLGAGYSARQGDVCRVVFPGASAFATRAHQDHCYLKRQDEVWSLWIPLSDCPRTMGPLVVWPESHKQGLLPHDPVTGCTDSCVEAKWASFDFVLGDALLVHKLTVHRALPNESEQIRVSVDFRFSRGMHGSTA